MAKKKTTRKPRRAAEGDTCIQEAIFAGGKKKYLTYQMTWVCTHSYRNKTEATKTARETAAEEGGKYIGEMKNE